MSDTMLFGVLKMPYEMAMRDEISRIQFYQRVQELVAKVTAQPVQEPIKPVAWLEPEWGEKICPEVGYEATMTGDHPRDLGWIPLVAQRPWVGLTKEDMPGGENPMFDHEYFIAGMVFAANILKEKNNG